MELKDGTPQNVSTGKNNDELTKELEFLRSENYILKGRIRGCETLGALLQESKELNKKLTEEKLKLQHRLDDSLIKNEKKQTGEINEFNPSLKQENPELVITDPKEMNKLKLQQSFDDSLGRYEQPGNTNEDSTGQENPKHIFTDNRKLAPLSIPMQESNNLEHSDLSAPLNFDLASSIHSQNEQESNLEYDSDKFEDAKYPEFNLSENIPAHFDPHMMTIGDSTTACKPNSDVSLFFPSNCTDDLRSNAESLSEEQFQRKTKEWADYVIKVKSENSQFKKLIKLVTEENKYLKSIVGNLKDENTKLLQKVKQLEHERDDLSPGSFADNTWVHINRDIKFEKEMLQETGAHAESKLMRELKEANTAWREKWNSLERSHSFKNKQLQEKIKTLEEELTKVKSSHEKQLEEMDNMLLATKSKYEEEQDSKAEIAQELHFTKQKLTSLQSQMAAIETENSKLNHSKHLLEIELNALKNAREQPLTGNSRTLEEKETEIMVLKEQIAVFHEDFEKERKDRASAQTSRNQLKEENTKLKMEKETCMREANVLRHKIQELKSDNSAKQSKILSLNSEIQTAKQTINQLRQHHQQQFQVGNQSPQPYFYEAHNGFRGLGNVLPNQPTFEHLPGAWTCETCTYINYPGRTVCEICGYIRNITGQSPGAQAYTGQNGQDLTPRGRTDVEIDTVM